MLTAAFSALFAAVALASAMLVLAHAFRRSVGTGVMVLLIPAYILMYVFTQFEHRRKGLVVAGLLGCGALAGVLYGAAMARVLPASPPVLQQLP